MYKQNKRNNSVILISFLFTLSLLILISCDILSMPEEINTDDDKEDYAGKINLTVANNSIRIINGLTLDGGSNTIINVGQVIIYSPTFPYNCSLLYKEKSKNFKLYVQGNCPAIDGNIAKLIILDTSDGGDKNISVVLEDPLHDCH